MTIVAEPNHEDSSSPEPPARVALRFEPSGTAVRVPPGVTVFDAASWNGIAIDSTCGGHGTCKKCRVRIADGSVPISKLDVRAFDHGDLEQGWRLACRAEARGDLIIDVPPLVTRPKAATVGVGRQVILRPAVQKRYVELELPTLQDQRTDLERLFDAVDDLELRVETGVLRRLPRTLRDSDFRVTCVIVDDLLIDVEPGDTSERLHGIAFDLGTTTVVATLLDLVTGTPVAVRSMLNKQQPFGADVISRISATMLDRDALERLRVLACATLQELVDEVCEQGEVDHEDVYEVALAGNATMTQLALGIDPEPIGVAPFIMVAPSYPDMPATELGLRLHPRARATIFPALGAYVGGDIVAGLLATGMTRDKRLRLFIDVGTNCEIALGSAERLVCTAAPAGPAFEAAQIRCGMRAADGAIEVVRIRNDTIELDVIADAEPLGMCGSGLVDAVAELVVAGLLDLSGRFVPNERAAEIAPALSRRLVARPDGERIFVLHWQGEEGDIDNAVYLSQRDVRELQFAKASIATGWSLLVEELGIDISEIQQVLLAGSFGSYLSPASAVRIGLVPRLALPRIVSAGNVAGEGAKMALLSVQERHAATAMFDEVEYVELSDREDFNDRFVEELAFPVAQ
ncbi:MAG: ASKHA domain-containing protein [Thermoleophilia bacterium]|nr:ASKHA domain-containing protein [Thermoleophilia bacterium]